MQLPLLSSPSLFFDQTALSTQIPHDLSPASHQPQNISICPTYNHVQTAVTIDTVSVDLSARVAGCLPKLPFVWGAHRRCLKRYSTCLTTGRIIRGHAQGIVTDWSGPRVWLAV